MPRVADPLFGYGFLVFIRNRQPPVFAEGAGREFDAWGGLTALVFALIDHTDDLFNDVLAAAFPDNPFERTVFFDIVLEDRAMDTAAENLILMLQFSGRRTAKMLPIALLSRVFSFAISYTLVFGRSLMTAKPPDMSPYSVQYPTAISLLLPVVRQPSELV